MPRMTHADLIAYEARQRKRPVSSGLPAEDEEALKLACIAYCNGRGWRVEYSRSDRKTTRRKGEVDLIIAADRGRTFWVELKSRTGKPTIEQLGTIAHLAKLGHKVACVDTFEGFVEFVEGKV